MESDEEDQTDDEKDIKKEEGLNRLVIFCFLKKENTLLVYVVICASKVIIY